MRHLAVLAIGLMGITAGISVQARVAPAPREIRAVWDHAGTGLYPGDWPRTMRELKARKITDVFVNVAGAGFAHYPSRVLPASFLYRKRGDQLAACLAAAKGTGIRVHAWVMCFSLARATPARGIELAHKGWRLKDKKGGWSDYLDASNPTLRAELVSAVEEILRRYSVAGIHLDYVRWFEWMPAAEASAGVMARYRAQLKGPSTQQAFAAWRARQIAGFVSTVRAHAKKIRPQAWLTAAVLGSPTARESVGQDWRQWLDRGWLDYAVPMNYTEDLARYDHLLSAEAQGHAARVISGIGVTANESNLTAGQALRQVRLTRAAHCAGMAFFDLDKTLMYKILPALQSEL